jgi:hypothetical protein
VGGRRSVSLLPVEEELAHLLGEGMDEGFVAVVAVGVCVCVVLFLLLFLVVIFVS